MVVVCHSAPVLRVRSPTGRPGGKGAGSIFRRHDRRFRRKILIAFMVEEIKKERAHHYID